MSLKIVILIAGLAGLLGIAIGYFLRLIISLGKKGSMELEIRQMMLEAQEKAKKIVIEAETKSVETMKEIRQETKEKEEKFKVTEDRLIKKESLLDQRQIDIDKEVENIKQKVEEIKEIRAKAEKLEAQKSTELQSIARMSEEDARNNLLSVIERKYEEDLLGRMKKLEDSGEEKLEHRARNPHDFYSKTFHISCSRYNVYNTQYSF